MSRYFAMKYKLLNCWLLRYEIKSSHIKDLTELGQNCNDFFLAN